MKYSLSPSESLRVKPKGFSEGSGYILSYIPTSVTIQTFSITTSQHCLSWEIILEKLILCIAPTAGPYGNILPSRLNNIRELTFNIIIFSN